MISLVAYVAVVVPDEGFAVAIAESDVAGYVIDKTEPTFPTWDAANKRAQAKNIEINVDAKTAWDIVASSMAASRSKSMHWSPRGSEEK